MKYIKMFLLLLMIAFFPTLTYASSAYIYVSGNNSVTIGNEIIVSLNISNISGAQDGIDSVGGSIVYNAEYLEFVSASNGNSNLTCTKSNSTNKFGCIPLTGATITSNSNLMNLKFRAKKTGNTSVSITDIKITSKTLNVTASSGGKTISIANPTTVTTTTKAPTTAVPTQALPTTSSNVVQSSQTTTVQATTKQQPIQTNKVDKITSTKKIADKNIETTTTRTKSTNNYLANLSTNVGILSPIFNKEKENYIVYLPYEVNKIEFSATPEDLSYAKVVIEGLESLVIGDNIYKIKVTAEDNNIRVYTINVVRNKSLEDDNSSSDTRLDSIIIKNGKLKEKFNSSLHIYHYTKKNKKFEIIAKSADKTSKVDTYSISNIYLIMITAQNGNKSFYILLPKRFNLIPILIIIIGLLIIYIILLRNKKNREPIRRDFPIFN